MPADDARWAALAALWADLDAAVGDAELDAATRCADGTGLRRSRQPHDLRVSGRLVPAPIPLTTVNLDPPADARRICSLWSIDDPVAVSGDVHQRSWSVWRAGPALPDPHGRRIETLPVTVGRWQVRIRLADRPAGPLPDVVSGASPAYDIAERGGLVASLDITPVELPVDADTPDDPADATTVVVRESGRPAVRAAIRHRGDGRSDVSDVDVVRDVAHPRTGSALLDALEGLALAAGSRRVRLDGSVFLHPDVVRVARHGYLVGPPYDGDADVPVWAERTLPPPVRD